MQNNLSSSASSSEQHHQQLDGLLPSYKVNADYKTFSSNNTKHQRESHQCEDLPFSVAPIIGAVPLPVLLTDLKKQSACIICPYCRHIVYTKVSGNSLIFNYMVFSMGAALYVDQVLPGFFLAILYLINAFIIVYNKFAVSRHQCPACSKEIAEYNGTTECTYITAPAITAVPLPMNV